MALCKWLDELPDKTFPNVILIKDLLQAIDSLDEKELNLENNNLYEYVLIYAENRARMPQVQNLAKTIINKWSRCIESITEDYDADGAFEGQYHKMKKKL